MPVHQSIPERTDIVVVGGGIMGTSTAYYLATETNHDVTLIEKHSIGSGSTGDSSAILRHHYGPQEVYSKMAWWSHQFYRRFTDTTGEPLAYDRSPLVRFATDGTPTASYVQAGFEVLDDLGIPVTRLDSEDLRSRFPMFDGLDRFDFAVSDDEAGYADGTDAATGFARAASNEGASIVTSVGVTAIESSGGTVTGVETDRGFVAADRVVLAAGPWTRRLAAGVGIDLPLSVSREQVLLVQPPTTYRDRYPSVTPTAVGDDGAWYVRPDFGARLLVATHHTEDSVDPDRYRRTPDEATVVELAEGLSAAIPELADADIVGRYCGLYTTTPDHDFIIDRIGPDGLLVACGFSGHGFKHGPAVGRAICDMLQTGRSDRFDMERFSLDRFEDDSVGHGRPIDDV